MGEKGILTLDQSQKRCGIVPASRYQCA